MLTHLWPSLNLKRYQRSSSGQVRGAGVEGGGKVVDGEDVADDDDEDDV